MLEHSSAAIAAENKKRKSEDNEGDVETKSLKQSGRMTKQERKKMKREWASKQAVSQLPPDNRATHPQLVEETVRKDQKKKLKKHKSRSIAQHAATTVTSHVANTTNTAITDDPPENHLDSTCLSLPQDGNTVNSLEIYATKYSSQEPLLLQQLKDATRKAMPEAKHMLSGPLQGRLLKTLVGIKSAKRILEIGTFTGYSALCMAEGLPEAGSLITCEIDPAAAAIAQEFFNKSVFGKKIELKMGPALDTLCALQTNHHQQAMKPFDLVFIDADKKMYKEYYDFLLGSDLLARDAMILADNVLFKGMVLTSDSTQSKTNKGDEKKANYWNRRHQHIADSLHEFNKYVSRDPRTEAVLLPLRDGLTVIRRVP